MKLNRVITILLSLVFVGVALAMTTPLTQAKPNGGVVTNCTDAGLTAALGGGGLVTFNCGANPYTITLSSMKIITADTTIDGGGKITLSGGDTVKVFFVNPAVQLTLNNLTVAHGNSSLGGCVTVEGTLNATHATFGNCASHNGTSLFAIGDGGAIFSFGGTVALTDSFVLNNHVDLDGGGLYLAGGQATLNHVSVLNNTANFTYTGSGGGVAMSSAANFVASDSSLSNNHIGYTGQGGGLYVYSSTALLVNTSADNNLADNAADGGGIYAENSQLTMQGGSARGNRGLYDGGGLALIASVSNISNAAIDGNVASSNGGGINAYQGSLSLNNVTVNNNTVDSDGGGIDLYSTPTSLVNVKVNSNTAGRDGAGINSYRSTLTLDQVTVSSNQNTGSALVGNQGDGGGIYNDSGALIATKSTIDHNTSTGTAGGIYNATGSTVDLTNVTLSSNVASTGGGGIYNEASFSSDVTAITLTNVTLEGNQSISGGGGIFDGNTANNFVNFKNTVIADSTSGNCAGNTFVTAKYSLSTDNTCALSGTGNHANTPAQLFPLLDNGGPTKTHLPAPFSALVNAVTGTDFPLTDQRGVTRPQGIGADIGAVERQASDPVRAPWVYLPLIMR